MPQCKPPIGTPKIATKVVRESERGLLVRKDIHRLFHPPELLDSFPSLRVRLRTVLDRSMGKELHRQCKAPSASMLMLLNHSARRMFFEDFNFFLKCELR